MIRKFWPRAGSICAAIVIVAGAAFFFAPLFASADGQAMILPVDPTPLVVESKGGRRSFSVEIARDPAERSSGLMFRQTMPDDRGMLFVFERTQAVGFWMKNTPMPLDLIFIGEDGRIRAVRQGEPRSEAVISPEQPVRFVLELKAGTAARNGIADGDLAKHPAISGAAGGAD